MTIKKRQSFKFKLCAYILGISVTLFALFFFANLYFVTQEVRDELSANAQARLDFVMQSLDEELSMTEVSAENILGISHSPLIPHKRDSIEKILEYFLLSNPNLQGVAVGFDRSVTKSDKGWCPYVMHMPDSSFKHRDVAEVRDYFSYNWYKIPYETKQPYWAEPFLEANGTVITAYCLPIVSDNGEVHAVIACDLSLNRFNDMLQDIKPYPHAILTVVDKNGTFIAHPNPDFILNESIESLMAKNKEGANRDIFDSIKKGLSGSNTYEGTYGKTYVFFAQHPRTGWTVALEVPQSDIAPGLVHMSRILIVLMILGIILMVVVCFVAINRLTKPLEKFALAAREISHGNFDAPLPTVYSHNELWDLRQAMASMKGSLKTYISQLEQTTKSKALIESELNIARRIQMALIPKVFPPFPERPELDIFASLIPAKAVGGDLYDYVLDGDDFFFCIGDVSGKGVPASLVMAITRSLFRNNILHTKSPAEVAKRINNAIAQGNDENMFVTMFIGHCDLKSGVVTLCNCGHNAPVTNGKVKSMAPVVITPGKEVHFISTAPVNLPVGVIYGFEYEEISMKLEAGVKILLYTDGITEAEDRHAKLYGEDRLIQTLSTLDVHDTAQTAVETLLADVHKHSLGAEQSDDITTLCICYRTNES